MIDTYILSFNQLIRIRTISFKPTLLMPVDECHIVCRVVEMVHTNKQQLIVYTINMCCDCYNSIIITERPVLSYETRLSLRIIEQNSFFSSLLITKQMPRRAAHSQSTKYHETANTFSGPFNLQLHCPVHQQGRRSLDDFQQSWKEARSMGQAT